MFTAAWKMLSAATIVNCFHKAGIMPPEDECENDNGSESGIIEVQNWQHLCKKLGIMFRQHFMTLLVS